MERKAQTHWQEEIQDVEDQSWIGEWVQGRNQSFLVKFALILIGIDCLIEIDWFTLCTRWMVRIAFR